MRELFVDLIAGPIIARATFAAWYLSSGSAAERLEDRLFGDAGWYWRWML